MFIFKDTKKRANHLAPWTSNEGVTYYRIPLELLEEIPEPTPPEDYSEDYYYRTEQDDAPYVVYTKKSDEQINQIRLNRAKTDRARLVDEITVTTTSGNVFDGNELAQNRMARALLGMNETDTMSWVLADNSIVAVTQAELKEALRLSGEAMAALWVKPYIPE